MSPPLRVAIVGASGIGRHHANWHDAVGSQVVAFVGTTPESCHETATSLASTFDFQGRGYTSIDTMLQQERPDIVDICSPHPTHYHAALRALQAGCHVLCEKPLVWDPDLSSQQLIKQVQHLQEIALAGGRHLGMCSQLAALLHQYHQVSTAESGWPSSFMAHMETTSRVQLRDAQEVWVDMGPHPISLILARCPGARIDTSTLSVEFAAHTAQTSFDVVDGTHRCGCNITVCDTEPPLRRRFGFDENIVNILGRTGEDGYYCAVLERDGVEEVGTDPMHLLIGQFTRVVVGEEAQPLVSAETALQNLTMQLEVLSRA